MAANQSGLTKMEIIGYKKSTFEDEHARFKVQFNPTTFKQEYAVEFVEDAPPGSTDSPQKLKKAPSKKLNITLTLDATGVTGQAGTNGSKTIDIMEEIKAFKKATYDFIGSTHDIPFVKIIWGVNTFQGRLRNLTVTHNMFKSNGDPLRSTLEASFESSKEASKQAKEHDLQSPDLTHLRTVKFGDTLPLMCNEIYNDCSLYLKVAKFNNLVDFRNLEPGTEIIFPPIV